MVGRNQGTITACHTEVEVIAEDAIAREGDEEYVIRSRAIGGITGSNAEEGEIIDTHAAGFVQGGNDTAGLVGANIGRIANCSVTGDVVGTDRSVGGLVGENLGPIIDCFTTGDVVGIDCVGGLVGEASGDGEISNCYATGEVKGEEGVGGLVGVNEGEIIGSYAVNPRLIRIGSADTFGRICGDNQREYVLTINFADLHMEAPFEEAFNSVAYDGKDGSDSDPAAVAAINGAANAAGGLSESEIDAGVFEAAGIGGVHSEELIFVKAVLDEAAQDVDGEVNWLPSEIYDIIDSFRK